MEDLALIYVIACSKFSSKSFIVSGLTFKPLIHCEFIFVFHSFTCSCPIFPAPFIEGTVFAHCIFFPPLSKIRYP